METPVRSGVPAALLAALGGFGIDSTPVAISPEIVLPLDAE